MFFKKSKLGFILASIYLLFAISIFIYAKTCSSMWCDMSMLFIYYPSIIIGAFVKINLFLVIILNLILFFYVGYGIEKLIVYIKNKN